ncbi:MAG: hypothetical protein QOE23_2338 [Pseudonocardiales bacterium]|nr:hypothetical protein [Pseudonocardiales bacterium]
MTAPEVVAVLDRLTPAAEEGWHLLFDLAQIDVRSWMLIGGQLVYLLAAENGTELPRPTDDIDVVIDVRARPGGTEWFAGWLVERGYELDGVSADGIGHRFTKAADPGPGTVVVDILAPEGLGERTSLFTRRPARTVQAPGSVQALERSEVVGVQVSGDTGRPARIGRVRRPGLFGALVAKASATQLAVRSHRERDWADAALLLSLLDDPLAVVEACSPGDRKRLHWLTPLQCSAQPTPNQPPREREADSSPL